MKVVLLVLALFGALQAHKIVPRQVTQLPNYTKLTQEQIKHLQNRGFGPTQPSSYQGGFQPTQAYEDDEEEDPDEDVNVASTQVRRPTYAEENYINANAIQLQQRPQVRQPQLQQVIKRPIQQQQQQYRPQYEDVKGGKLKEEEEEEKEEPDRLTLLLPQSKFDCSGKNTGYYADEDLGCEVFHYCQDNAKHSWICPEGFTFHQVHLICMPPGSDNICAKSSQFHFVNEFLYKPINLEEHQNKPNVSLKYSDRYYPDNYYAGRYDEEQQQQHYQRKQPIQVGLQQHVPAPQPQVVIRKPVQPTHFSPTFRPETTIGQVFRSPEEVNISLQQRRPAFVAQRYLHQDEIHY